MSYVNRPQSEIDAQFLKGSVYRLLSKFPRSLQVPIGTAALVSVGAMCFGLTSMGKKPSRANTPEWQKATEDWMVEERINPIRRYKESKEKAAKAAK